MAIDPRSEMNPQSIALGKPCVLIIVVGSVERFAYKGVASNLLMYLTGELGMSTASAAKSITSWYGVTSMLPMVGAMLADLYWDRYSTILGSSLLYVLALVSLTAWTYCPWLTPPSIFIPLYLISVAQGGYNPSIQAFGADQFEARGDNNGSGEQKKTKFFQWWYFGICVGSLLGNSTMSYIQDNYGWHIGFAIPTAAMAASIMFFASGTRLYVRKKNKDGPERSLKENLLTWITTLRRALFARRKLGLEKHEQLEIELESKPLECNPDDRKPSPYAVDETPPTTTNMTSVILRLLPTWATLLMLAVVFQQPTTFFTKQGATMCRSIVGDLTVPPAALQSAITASIILLMPLYDKVIVPVLRVVTCNERGVNVTQRIGIGMVLSMVAMAVAAMVERKRVAMAAMEKQMVIWWLLPQYVLLGVADVFAVVGMQEFFYTRVPITMRTMGIALCISVFGVGSFLGSSLIALVEAVTMTINVNGRRKSGWLSDDNMGEAGLYKYYWLLAGLSALSFVLFSCLQLFYGSETCDDVEKVGDGGE